MKGDNNTWIDGYSPTSSEIYGKLWVHIPGAGKIILTLKKPIVFASLIGVGVYLIGKDYLKSSQPARRKLRD